MVAAAAILSVLIVPACNRCTAHVDYTIPPVAEVFSGAEAVVIARVRGFPRVDRWAVQADLAIEQVLVQQAGSTPSLVPDERVEAWAYDDPCGRRTGLRFADGELVIVVLKPEIPSNQAWETTWFSQAVLRVDDDGTVRFLDTGDQLNERIDQIMPSATVEGLLQAVSSFWGS
jgi:hypothetical protein